MDKSDVTEYHARDGTAELIFKDGSQLMLYPYRNWGNIEGFDSAVLYQNGTLEALATDRPSRYSKPEESGFFSKGKITQQQLAKYWNTATKIGRQANKDFDAGKINEDIWHQQFWEFWRITSEGRFTRKALEKGDKQVFEENPNRFDDRI